MKKIRYGIIGTKGFGKHHLWAASLHPGVEITGICDVDQDFISTKAKELGVPGFVHYQDMLNAGIVDAVSIAVPHHLHFSIGRDCLEAGVHIYIEKPFVNTISQADTMIQIAEKRNLKICVGYQYRTFQCSRFLKNCLAEDRIGKVMRILWSWLDFRPEAYYRRDRWRCDFMSAGGGVLMNQASHDIDLIQWMFGKPREICAFIGNQMHESEIEDIACVNAIFPNGSFGNFQFGINHPKSFSIRQISGDKGMIAIQNVQSLVSDKEDFIEIGLYEKELSLLSREMQDPHGQPDVQWKKYCVNPRRSFFRKLFSPKQILRRLGFMPMSLREKISPGIYELLDSFVNSILTNSHPLVDAQSSRDTMEFINAIFVSAMKKKAVTLPLNPQEYDSLYEEIAHGKNKISRFFNR